MTAGKVALEALERQGWAALSGSDGARFYASVMGDDGVMVFPGLVLDKEQAVAAIAGAPPWSSYELSDLRVIESAPGSAIVIYQAQARRAGGLPYRALMSSAYVLRGGRWELVLHQQTPDPQGDDTTRS